MTSAILHKGSVALGHPAHRGLRVTQGRVLHSEWIKLRSLRSTFFTMIVGIGFMTAIGLLSCLTTAMSWATTAPQEKAGFSAITASLSGFSLAQLAIGVLGVLVISGEYSTGMIRATLSAVPPRLPVLWAKAAVFGSVTLVLTLLASFIAFFGGQAFLSSQHIQAAISDPGAARAVVGAALYLTLVGLLGVALGALIRNTAGGIATLFGIVLVLPLLSYAVPETWQPNVLPYLPTSAGEAIMDVKTHVFHLAPWTGLAVFALYTMTVLAASAVLMKRRDA